MVNFNGLSVIANREAIRSGDELLGQSSVFVVKMKLLLLMRN